VIHYHGSPLGGKKEQAARFYAGRHAFVSFANPQDLPIIAEVSQSFALDNGAFSSWSSGERVDYEGYVDWCAEWMRHPGFDWAVIPDIIDGSPEENDEYISRWPSDIQGVPVWHLHESTDRLLNLANSWPRIALGSSGAYRSPGTDIWWGRVGDAMSAICDDSGRPITRLHGLRMLNTEVFRYLPLASADSCNAAINSGSLSRFGMYTPPSSAQRAEVIASRIEMINSSPVWAGAKQEKLFKEK
jgi:hypothetical protein